MTEIKTDETHLEHQIKIKRRGFYVLLLHMQRGDISVIYL